MPLLTKMNLAGTQGFCNSGLNDAQQNGKTEYLKYQQLLGELQNEENKSKAFYWLQCAAETGHPRAQYELGKQLAYENDSIAMAVYWLQKAAVQGVGDAFAELEELYGREYQNTQPPINKAKLYADAAPLLQKAAEVGGSAATVEFATCCYFGYGVEVNGAKAFQLYVQQTERGNVRAMMKLGDCYKHGVGVGFDDNLAAQCYRMAVECGSPTGMLELAACQNANLDNFKRGVTAIDLVKQTAELGDAKAQYHLGRCYANGIGIARDKQQAIAWYERAALKNNADAMCALAELSIKSGDFDKAAALFGKAAGVGSAVGQRRFADCYFDGIGVKIDLKRAVALYKQAAELLNVPALRKLGMCYLSGIGVEKDINQAVALLKLAAAAGDAGSQVYYAELLLRGQKPETNNPKAIAMLQSAADKGDRKAACKLAECCELGIGLRADVKRADEIYAQLDLCGTAKRDLEAGTKLLQRHGKKAKVEAFELFKRAAKARNAEGCYQAGLCQESGIGTQKDVAAAVNLYKQAADLGHEAAAVRLARLYATKQAAPESAGYAFELYCRTAETAGQDVQFELAWCYENGIGTAKNVKRADEIYERLGMGSEAITHVKTGIRLLQSKWQKNKCKAFEHFKQAAEVRNPDGCCQAGQCYQNGVGTQKDIAAAVEMYKLAANMNYEKACVKLAQLYATRQAQPESAEHAFELYCKAAEVAGSDVQFELAQCYENGIGTARTPKQAAQLYQELVKSKHAKALSKLISMHQNGVLGDPHSNEAIEMYMCGFENGNVDAMCELARCCYENRVSDEVVMQIMQNQVVKTIVSDTAKEYANGFAEPASDEQMFAALKLAENENDLDVLCALGRCYDFGWGVEKDVAKAVEYYIKAADAGSFEAMERLRVCKYEYVDEQLKTAFEHFKQLADAGNINAKFAVAYCYDYGIGTASNSSLARQMCEAAANQQNSNMMILLGYMYECGNGVEENQAKAFELYKQAADAGNKQGLFKLGLCYFCAWGVAQDYKQAVFWYEKAAAQGHAYAVNWLGTCYENGYGVEKDLQKTFQYYKQAAIAGNELGQYNVGNCYKDGKGVQQSYQRAAYWYQKAAKQGYSNVVENLEYCLEQLSKTLNGGTDIPKAEPETKSTQSVNANQRHEIAFYLAKLAANSGCNRAYSCLGDCYFNGIGTVANITAAARSYERAEPSDSQKYLNLVKCLETGQVDGRNEIHLLSALHQVNAALRQEINSILLQML